MTKKPKKQLIPEACPLDMPASDYQPSRAELREETDMPKMTIKQARQAFFRPFQLTGGKASGLEKTFRKGNPACSPGPGSYCPAVDGCCIERATRQSGCPKGFLGSKV